ncbi:hypothetical protein [Ilumatobacter sp.]|uniref:hypothetical protein n=1 Tax=Ilumatobacter sp. TaxID=1967498 RepID=UPI003B522D12
MSDTDNNNQAFMSALVTEHFVLQSARGGTTFEASGRSSIYLAAVSTSLVALGFMRSNDNSGAGPFIAAVLPTLWILGELTYKRLVDLSVEDLAYLRSIQKIRTYYSQLTPDAAAYFPTPNEIAGTELVALGRRKSWTGILFGVASTIAAVNSVLGAAAIAIGLNALGTSITFSAIIAIVIAAALFTAHVLHQLRRHRTDT